MPWSILWTDQATRDMARLDPPIARRIIRKLEQAADNPSHYFRRLVASDDYKLRIGDHRVMSGLDPGSRTILAERVGHRSSIYERGSEEIRPAIT